MRQASISTASLIVVAAIASAREARAQAPSADALFQEGLKLFDAGRTHEACERFAQSYHLDAALGTLQNLATCHEQEGRTARAHAEFEDLVEKAARAGPGHKAREVLGRQHAAALAKKLSKIELQLGAGPNVEEIRIDDAPLARPLWQAPVNLDPGAHTLVFRAAGKREASVSITVATGPSAAPVDVPHLADTPPAAPPPRHGVSLRTIGIVTGGAGALGIVLGAVFGGVTFAQKGAASAHCTGQYCDPQGLALMDSAHGYAAASTTAFVLGIGAAGAGAFLFVWGGREGRADVRVGAAPGGLRVSGAF